MTTKASRCPVWLSTPACGPLYEWKDGVFRRQRIPRKTTVSEYVASQRRYAHLNEDEIRLMEEYVQELDDMLGKLERGSAA